MRKSKSNVYKPQAKTTNIHRITPGTLAPFHNQNFGKQQQLSKPVQSFDEWGTKRAAEKQYPEGRYITNGGYNHTHPGVEDPAVAFLNGVLAEYRAKGQHMLTVSISDDRMDCGPHSNELMDVDEPGFNLDTMDVDEVQMVIPIVDPSAVCVPMDTTEDRWMADSWAMDVDVKDQMTAPFRPPGIPAFGAPRSGFGAQKASVEQELASGVQARRLPAPAPTYSYTPTPPKYNVPTPIVRARSATRPALSNVQNHSAPRQPLPSAVISSNHSQITKRKASLTLEVAYITLGVRSLEISTLDRAVVTSRSPTPGVTTSTALIVREPEPVKTPVVTEVLCQCKRVATPPVAETQVVLRSVSPITNSPPSTNTDEPSCFDTADLLRLDFEDPVHSTPIAAGASPYPASSPEFVELWEDLASLKGALFCSPVEKDLLLFDPIPLAGSLTVSCEPFAYRPVDSEPESSIVSPAPAYESYDRPPSASEPSSPESVDNKSLLLNGSAEGKLLAPITSNGVTKIMQFRYRRSVRDKKRDKSSDKRRSSSPTSSPNSIGGTRQLTRVTDVDVPLKHKRAENEPSETEVHTNADFSASDRPITSYSRTGKMGAHATKSPLPAVSKEASKVNSVSSPSSPRESTTTNNAVSHDKPSKSTLLPLSTDMPGGYPKSPSPPPNQLSANEMVVVSTPATISSPTRIDAIKADAPTASSTKADKPSSVDVEVSPSVPATTPTDYLPYTHAAMEKEGRLVRRRPFIHRAPPALRSRRNPAESVDPKGARQRIRLAEPTKVEKATPLPIPFAPPTPVIVQAVVAAPKPFHSKSKPQSQTTYSVLRQWIGFPNRGEKFKVLSGTVPNADYHDLDVVHAVPLPPPSIWTRGMVRFFGWA